MTNGQELLSRALSALLATPIGNDPDCAAEVRSNGCCLHDTRIALGKVGLKLPQLNWPDDTALANFKVLDPNPVEFGWRSVGLDDVFAIKLVYFQHTLTIPNPPRDAGHIGLLSGGMIYSDVNRKLSPWWRSRFVGAFVPLDNSPRAIVVRAGGPAPSLDGNTYQQIPSTWNAEQNTCIVQTQALQIFLQTSVPNLPAQMPICAALTALGQANASFNLTHMQDPVDPRIYVFT